MLRGLVFACLASCLAAGVSAQPAPQTQVATYGAERWIGKSPIEVFDGRDFFDHIQQISGTFWTEQTIHDLKTLSRTCAFSPVRLQQLEAVGTSRLMFSAQADCPDGLQVGVFAPSPHEIGFSRPDAATRVLTMEPPSICMSRAADAEIRVCGPTETAGNCRVSPKPAGFSCSGDAIQAAIETQWVERTTRPRICETMFMYRPFARMETDPLTGSSSIKSSVEMDQSCRGGPVDIGRPKPEWYKSITPNYIAVGDFSAAPARPANEIQRRRPSVAELFKLVGDWEGFVGPADSGQSGTLYFFANSLAWSGGRASYARPARLRTGDGCSGDIYFERMLEGGSGFRFTGAGISQPNSFGGQTCGSAVYDIFPRGPDVLEVTYYDKPAPRGDGPGPLGPPISRTEFQRGDRVPRETLPPHLPADMRTCPSSLGQGSTAAPGATRPYREAFTCACIKGIGNTFGAPAGGSAGFYHERSAICSAAQHAGVIGPDGGVVKVTPYPPMGAVAGSTQNGVTSRNYYPGNDDWMMKLEPVVAASAGPAAPGPAQSQ